MPLFRRAPVAAGQAGAARPGGSPHFLTYALLSALGTGLLVTHAFKTHQQFYPAIIYLVTSKISILILGNMGLMLTLLLGRIMKTIFLGQLRDVEVEILYDNARYAVTETCLALTIFREELTTRVLTLFTALLFSKSFHWLCQSRVEYVESDNVSRCTHVRLVTLMATLLVVDIAFVAMCVYLWNGPSVLILFGFEYAILAVSVISTLARYVLHVIDMSIEGNWPAKGSYLFFLEFATEVVRFLCYVVFFTMIFTHYGMPLHIVRDLWMSYVSLKRRLIVFSKYRKLTANMNERFPDANAEELAACEHTCIICRDGMEHGKKLPCSHIFHLDCLRLWLQQQQSCPTCRAEIPTDVPPPRAPTQPPHQPPPMQPQQQGAAAHAQPGGADQAGAQHQAQAQAARPAGPTPRTGAGAPAPHAVPPVPLPPAHHQPFPAPPMPYGHPGMPMPMGPPMAFPFPPSPFGPPFALPPWAAGPPPPFPSTAAAGAGPGAPMRPDSASQAEGFQVEGAQSPWFRVIDPNGAEVRDQPDPSANVIRVVPQGEIVLCVGSQAGRDAGVTARRVLNGGWIVESTGADGEGTRLLERLAPGAIPPWTAIGSPVRMSASVAGGGAMPSTGFASAPRDGSQDRDLRYELQSARTSVELTMADMNSVMARYQNDVRRLEELLSRVEAAAAAVQGGADETKANEVRPL